MDFKIKEINTRLNCFEISSLFKDEKNNILLDSSKEDSDLSKFSFLGVNPFLIFKSFGDIIEVNGKKLKGNAFLELEKLIDKYSLKNINSKLPFVSGAIGYISYDAGRLIEDLPNTAKEDVKIPDVYFVFYDNLIIEDLKNNKKYISALGILKDSKESIKELEENINNGKKIKEEAFDFSKNKFYSNFSEQEYIEGVKKVKDYIINGDIYITNLTQRMWCYNNEDTFSIYKKLRTINKAPFSAYLNLDDFEVISSSPERFLNILNGKVETRPIKGTRRRGETKEEDLKNKLELKNSMKDKSELLMIVDLERNDLSKVCKPHSVKVSELFKIEEYATVFHLVSNIEGRLKEGVSHVKCLKECFPGGSITGAPKIRSQEIIEEIEKVRRGIYTGSIGYFDLRGNADFNIVIRTIVKKDGKAYFGVGGGITIDSEEKMEYEETLDKAKALMRVTQLLKNFYKTL